MNAYERFVQSAEDELTQFRERMEEAYDVNALNSHQVIWLWQAHSGCGHDITQDFIKDSEKLEKRARW